MPTEAVDREDAVAEAVERSLEQNEEIILRQAGVEFGSFVEAGRALADIHDREQYKAKFDRFEDYCREQLEHSRAYAYMKIGAFRVATIVDAEPKPKNIAQARPLMRLLNEAGEDEVKEVWASVVESTAKITATVVQEAVRRHLSDSAASGSPHDRVARRYQDALSALEEGVSEVRKAITSNAAEKLSEGMRERFRTEAKAVRAVADQMDKIANGEEVS